LYIFNAVIIPWLKYHSQLIFLSEDKCSWLIALFRKLFKYKLNLNQCIPNAILHSNLFFNFRFLFKVKVHSMFTNLVCLLNDPNLARLIIKIRLRQLQTHLHLAQCPLIAWPFNSSSQFKDNIANLLSILPQFNLLFEYNSSWSNIIQEKVFTSWFRFFLTSYISNFFHLSNSNILYLLNNFSIMTVSLW